MEINEINQKHLNDVLHQIQRRSKISRICPKIDDLSKELTLVGMIGQQRCRKFKIDDENEFLYKNLILWANADTSAMAIDSETGEEIPADPNKGIYIAGNTGTGKSVALEVIGYYCDIKEMRVQQPYPYLFRWQCINAIDLHCEFAQGNDLGQKINAPTLAIQDIGAEPEVSAYMGNKVDIIRMIIERRGDKQGIFTMATSNIPLGKIFAKRYGDRAASRTHEMFNYYILTGKDRRK